MNVKEKTVVNCKNHWLCLVFPCAIGVFFLLGFIGGLLNGDASTAVFSLVITAICALWAFVRYKINSLVMTETAIIGRIGLIRTTKLVSPISKVQDVSVSSGLFGKIFGYSTVTISTAGSNGSEYVFKKVVNGDALQREFVNRAQ